MTAPKRSPLDRLGLIVLPLALQATRRRRSTRAPPAERADPRPGRRARSIRRALARCGSGVVGGRSFSFITMEIRQQTRQTTQGIC